MKAPLISSMTWRDDIQNRLIDWYHIHRRILPWRQRGDAYAIWVSEIMLQQTQVETVKAYFNKFMEAFPKVEDLAQANEQEVLALWSGLGYYARARNLHLGAKMVMLHHGGQLPGTIDGLRSIRGIGPYTAGAIASIAYGQPEPLLDGNVARVYSRFFALVEDPKSTIGKKALWSLAAQMVSPKDPSSYNQALMELGALICTPTSPTCEACPLGAACEAKAQHLQLVLPVKPPKKVRPHVDMLAIILRGTHGLVLARRPSKGLLGGLWEFPLIVVGGGEELTEGVAKRLTTQGHGEFPAFDGSLRGVRDAARWRVGVDVGVLGCMPPISHLFTHLSAKVVGVMCEHHGGNLAPRSPTMVGGLLVEYAAMEWFDWEDVGSLPMGKIAKQLVSNLKEESPSGKSGEPSRYPGAVPPTE